MPVSERTELLLEALPYRAVIIDGQGFIRQVNERWLNFARDNGISEEECGEGVNYLQVIEKAVSEGAENASIALTGIKDVLDEKKGEFVLEYPCHSSVQKRWFKMKAGTCKEGALILHEDITPRKNYQLQLKKSRERFRKLTESVKAILWVYNAAEDRWEYVAPQAKEILGYAPEDWDNLDFWADKLHPDDREWAVDYCLSCAEEGREHEFEYRFRTASGEYIWLKDAVRVEMKDGEPVKLRGLMLDITERKEHEEKLARLNRRLEKQMERGKKLHDHLLPEAIPEPENFSVNAHYEPAEKLGGDFYDFIARENQLIFYLSDVSGHDLSSSMINVFLQETVNSCLRNPFVSSGKYGDIINPGGIVDCVRENFKRLELPPDYFISLLVGVLDTKNASLKLCNAGIHFLPKLMREGEIIDLSSSGMPITSLEKADYNYDISTLEFQAGDTLFACTDGLIEQEIENVEEEENNKSTDIYGEERLKSILTQNAHRSPDEIIDKINGDLKKLQGNKPVKDDISYIILQRE